MTISWSVGVAMFRFSASLLGVFLQRFERPRIEWRWIESEVDSHWVK